MVKQTDYFKQAIGLIVLCGVFALIFLLAFHEVPDKNREVIIQQIGTIVGMAGIVVAYEYGSSKSSADKDIMLMNSTPLPTNSVTNATTVSVTKKGDGAEDVVVEKPKE